MMERRCEEMIAGTSPPEREGEHGDLVRMW